MATATQETKTDEKQNQQAQGREGKPGSQLIGFIAPMDLSRMNPFSLMRRMTEEMDRVFGDGGQERERFKVARVLRRALRDCAPQPIVQE